MYTLSSRGSQRQSLIPRYKALATPTTQIRSTRRLSRIPRQATPISIASWSSMDANSYLSHVKDETDATSRQRPSLGRLGETEWITDYYKTAGWNLAAPNSLDAYLFDALEKISPVADSNISRELSSVASSLHLNSSVSSASSASTEGPEGITLVLKVYSRDSDSGDAAVHVTITLTPAIDASSAPKAVDEPEHTTTIDIVADASDDDEDVGFFLPLPAQLSPIYNTLLTNPFPAASQQQLGTAPDTVLSQPDTSSTAPSPPPPPPPPPHRMQLPTASSHSRQRPRTSPRRT